MQFGKQDQFSDPLAIDISNVLSDFKNVARHAGNHFPDQAAFELGAHQAIARLEGNNAAFGHLFRAAKFKQIHPPWQAPHFLKIQADPNVVGGHAEKRVQDA
jgi:hypothetical protein